MHDIENPEIRDEQIPIVKNAHLSSDINASPGDSNDIKTSTKSESLKLDLCLATFLVEAVSSIGTRARWNWEEWLCIGSREGFPNEPKIENLKEVLIGTPLETTLQDSHAQLLVESDLASIYEELTMKDNVRARLQLMSWALQGSTKSKLQMQAAMLCNLSKAHWNMTSDKKTRKEEESSGLKWVSNDVLKLWLKEKTMKDVFLVDLYSKYGEFIRNTNWEIIVWNNFLMTLSFYGDAGIKLELDKEKPDEELKLYFKSLSLVPTLSHKVKNLFDKEKKGTLSHKVKNLFDKVKKGTGPLIPLSESEMGRNLVYAHEILDEHRRHEGVTSSNIDLLFNGDRKEHDLEYLSNAPFSTSDLIPEIRHKEDKWQCRREEFEKKIKDLTRHPFGTISRGNWGRQLCGVLFIITVLIATFATCYTNPINREHILERVFDAVELGTILTVAATILVKVKSSDSSVLRNSVFGTRLFLGFDEVQEHCGIRSQIEFCLLLASRKRKFRWLSEENLPFVNGLLAGEIRKERGMKLFELSRMGFTIEGNYLFNPYTGRSFKILKESESEATLKDVTEDKGRPIWKSLTAARDNFKRLSHSMVVR